MKSFVTTYKEILNRCETFYKELYLSKIGLCDDNYDDLFLDEPSQKKLTGLNTDFEKTL